MSRGNGDFISNGERREAFFFFFFLSFACLAILGDLYMVLGSGITTSRIKTENIITADGARFSKLSILWTDVSSKVKRLHYIDIMLSILLNIILPLSTQLSAWEKAYSDIGRVSLPAGWEITSLTQYLLSTYLSLMDIMYPIILGKGLWF